MLLDAGLVSAKKIVFAILFFLVFYSKLVSKFEHLSLDGILSLLVLFCCKEFGFEIGYVCHFFFLCSYGYVGFDFLN